MVSRYERLLATLRLDFDEHLDELDRCWWAMTRAEQEEVEGRLGPGHAPPRMLEMSSKEGQVQVPEADRVYTAWVILSPAQDVPGTWVAHALDFDVVTQGSSAEDALQMGFEAVAIVLSDDLRDGRDPYRRRAPSECWAQLHELQEHGERIEIGAFAEKLRESRFDALAVTMWFKPVLQAMAGTRSPYDAPLALASYASTSAHV